MVSIEYEDCNMWHPHSVSDIHKKECKTSVPKFNVAVIDSSYMTIRLHTRSVKIKLFYI